MCSIDIYTQHIKTHIHAVPEAVWWSEFSRESSSAVPGSNEPPQREFQGRNPPWRPKARSKFFGPGMVKAWLRRTRHEEAHARESNVYIENVKFCCEPWLFLLFCLFWGGAPQNLLLYREGNMSEIMTFFM